MHAICAAHTGLMLLADVFIPPSPTAGGWLAGETRPVPAAPLAYDAALASQLWDLSADVCKLPRQPRLVQSRP